MNSFELYARGLGFRKIAGIDEAGRGPLAGPVVAAAVILPCGYENSAVRDSKTLTPRKREAAFDMIQKDALSIGLGVVGPSVIDSINILRATQLAMEKAVSDLSIAPDYLLIDGINTINVSTEQKAVTKGDSLSVSIAAASIIAKVSRDRMMDACHERYPQYNFAKHKGYGTREHREALQKFGYSEIHRRSFKLKNL